MTIEYGTLKNANVSIDSDDGAVWLWITSGMNTRITYRSVSDPSIEEVLKQWARQQDGDGLALKLPVRKLNLE